MGHNKEEKQMAEIKYGQLNDWNDGEVSLQSDFMNLQEGSNVLKVLTNPYQFIVHWVKDQSNCSSTM